MKYVDLDARIGSLTGVLSPARYLGQLPRLSGALPPGALAFATDGDHYDFASKRCTKDLRPHTLRHLDGGDGPLGVEVHLRHNCWKHDEDLIVRYHGVVDLRIEGPRGTAWADLGPVILDEVLPHEHGCSHETAFRPGALTVVCRDLTATWIPADCSD